MVIFELLCSLGTVTYLSVPRLVSLNSFSKVTTSSIIGIQREHIVGKNSTLFAFHLTSLQGSGTTVFPSLLFHAFCSIQLSCAVPVFKII